MKAVEKGTKGPVVRNKLFNVDPFFCANESMPIAFVSPPVDSKNDSVCLVGLAINKHQNHRL
ncbi:hypothetical protein BLOT_007472 [Blomia tropicalis]|nr:hypothetical protein BLOT_007472 [Blomia tropicalis]